MATASRTIIDRIQKGLASTSSKVIGGYLAERAFGEVCNARTLADVLGLEQKLQAMKEQDQLVVNVATDVLCEVGGLLVLSARNPNFATVFAFVITVEFISLPFRISSRDLYSRLTGPAKAHTLVERIVERQKFWSEDSFELQGRASRGLGERVGFGQSKSADFFDRFGFGVAERFRDETKHAMDSLRAEQDRLQPSGQQQEEPKGPKVNGDNEGGKSDTR